ncbi:lycopene cyclase family protein [Streptomyces europaeiscabiei]|uniref:lycopene cyclase family protein n=1 Tax=Streptomyces europaeiscabiei TaxID=146819 RepID=UPI0029B2CC69|nr:lycopene cyclase family protein [Streptomyces europaeiscabiei]MDX3710431.1 lycopene cyclase family protein [Streptomyces europaeiscabiei]MDX3865030.1 lycopene cyclase family protein [Streptomyces europaeiscabiei]MDX3872495.1 lycopene cyclase family protein [Streptomyces europaeiscabiei]
MLEADVAIVGAGAAGLSLAHRLSRTAPGSRHLSVILMDAPPGPLRPPSRTWCFWEKGPGPYDAALSAVWRRLRVRTPEGRILEEDIAPLTYKMIRSDDFEELVARALARSDEVRRLEAVVETVDGVAGGAEIRARTGLGAPVTVRARWVFDSRPLQSLPAARTTLLQHFHGWFVRTEQPVFDRGTVEFMDFRVPQPPGGLAFGYVLPTDSRQALLEYTEFSGAALSHDAYDAALRRYTEEVLGLSGFEIVSTETGVIPMTDARFERRSGPSVFRIGTAGGATRPSTGYTFSAIQRQTRAVADALRAGRHPLPPPAHKARSRAMDAVLLRALDSGRVDGAAFFARLFSRLPTERLLRFLDGGTRLHEDLAIGVRTPVLPMLRSAAELSWLPRRPAPHPISGRPLPDRDPGRP